MEFVAVVWLVFLATLCLGVSVLMVLIRGYLNSKPLGMQTLMDTMTADLTVVVQTSVGVFCSIMSAGMVFSPVALKAAHALSLIEHVATVAVFCTFLIYAITRYISIYHGPLLDMYDDSTVVGGIRLSIVVLICLVWSDSYLSRKGGYAFTLLVGSTKFSQEYGIAASALNMIVVTSALLLLFITQIRVEWENRKLEKKQGLIPQAEWPKRLLWCNKNKVAPAAGQAMASVVDQPVVTTAVATAGALTGRCGKVEKTMSKSELWTLRTVISLWILSAVVILVNMTSKRLATGHERVATISLAIFMCCIVVPLLLIGRNEKMKNYAKAFLVQKFPHGNNNYSKTYPG